MPQLAALQRPVPASRIGSDLGDSDEASNGHHCFGESTSSNHDMVQSQQPPLSDIVIVVPQKSDSSSSSVSSSSMGYSHSSSQGLQRKQYPRRRTSRCDITLASEGSSKDTSPVLPRKGGLPQHQEQDDDSISSCSATDCPSMPRRRSRCDKTLCHDLTEHDISPKLPTRKDSNSDLANTFFAACRASLVESDCFQRQTPAPSMDLFKLPSVGDESSDLEPESIWNVLDEVEQIIAVDVYGG